MVNRGALRAHARRIAGLTLVALCVHSSVSAYERLVRFDSDERCAKRFDLRFSRLRQHLPATGIVGYVGPRLSDDGCDSLFLAQLSLAPVLVSHVEDDELRRAARRTDIVVPDQLPLVIVDTQEPAAKVWLEAHPGYSLVIDAGDGLYLAARTR
jgi:hypothetical protein